MLELRVPLVEVLLAYHDHNTATAYDEFIGVRRIREWLEKVALAHLPPNTLPMVSQPSHSRVSLSSGHSCPPPSTSSSGTVTPSKGPRVISADAQPNAQPSTSTTLRPDVRNATSHMEGGDSAERANLPVRRSTRIQSKARHAQGHVKGVAEPNPNKLEQSPLPTELPRTQSHSLERLQTQDKDMVEEISAEHAQPIGGHATQQDTGRRRSKRLMKIEPNDEGAVEVPYSGPPKKRRKTQEHAQLSRTGSGALNQHIDRDPAGNMDNQISRHVFITIFARFRAAHEGPWIIDIPDTQFRSALQTIQNTVHQYIQHKVILSGRVYHVAQQNFSDSRAGFAAVAIAAITDFFANSNSNIYSVPAARIAYARTMLERHRFLFRENHGPHKAAWSGLWRAPFVLQTFACHFNFIQGYMGTTPRAALALSCAAVCHALTLVANNIITFGTTQDGWFAAVQQGGQFEFNEDVCGAMTRRFLQPIMSLSDEQFGIVVEETRVYVMKAQETTPITLKSEVDEEFRHLYEFR